MQHSRVRVAETREWTAKEALDLRAAVPADVIDKLQIVFYSDPTNAAFRAMGLE